MELTECPHEHFADLDVRIANVETIIKQAPLPPGKHSADLQMLQLKMLEIDSSFYHSPSRSSSPLMSPITPPPESCSPRSNSSAPLNCSATIEAPSPKLSSKSFDDLNAALISDGPRRSTIGTSPNTRPTLSLHASGAECFKSPSPYKEGSCSSRRSARTCNLESPKMKLDFSQ